MVGSTGSTITPSPPVPSAAVNAQPYSIDSRLVNTRDYLTPEERREREELKDRLRERVAYQQMARNIRAKLQYAAYKVRHNVTHLTFEALEASARQETAAAGVSNPNAQVHEFVAAGTSMAKGDPASVQHRSSMAPPSIIPTGASTSNPRGLPRRAVEGADATQSLYASILAQPPPRRARTIQNVDTQLASVASSSKQSGSSRTRKDRYRGDGEYTTVVERTRGHKNSEPAASGSGSKRKAPANALRSKTTKQKRGDDAAAASHHNDREFQAAVMLTKLLHGSNRSRLHTGNLQSPRERAAHGLSYSDIVTRPSSIGYQQSSARMQPLFQSAEVAGTHIASHMNGNTVTWDPVRPGGLRNPASGVKHLPPHARKLGQKREADDPRASHNADMPPPTVRITPPMRTVPVPTTITFPDSDTMARASAS